jgi:energy-coupling factor transport system substrate-specific component
MSTYRWRTVDIVVASTIAVAFGVIFWAWTLLYNAVTSAFTFFPPAQTVMYGIWLVPAVLGPWIVRKPGAAVYCETVAAIVSALLGSIWGTVVWQGLIEGAAAELVFLAVLYRVWRLPVAVLAAAAAGLAAAVSDLVVYWAGTDFNSFKLPYTLITVASCVLIAGFGTPALTKALAATGVLDRFAAGRARELV